MSENVLKVNSEKIIWLRKLSVIQCDYYKIPFFSLIYNLTLLCTHFWGDVLNIWGCDYFDIIFEEMVVTVAQIFLKLFLFSTFKPNQ